MKHLTLTILFILFLVFSVLSQSQCPTISISEPKFLDDAIVFTANLNKESENYKIEYLWIVTGGKIVDGQGTKNVKIVQNNYYERTDVTLEIKGLPENCPNKTDEVWQVPVCGLTRVLADRYSEMPSQINRKSLSEFAKTFQADLGNKALIIEQFKSGTSRDAIRRKLINTFLYLTQDLRFPANRIIWQILDDTENRTYLYYLSEGADLEPYWIDQIKIKGEDFQNQINRAFPKSKRKTSKTTRKSS